MIGSLSHGEAQEAPYQVKRLNSIRHRRKKKIVDFDREKMEFQVSAKKMYFLSCASLRYYYE